MTLVKNITGSVHNEPTANYLEHDDHVALVENIAIGVYCVHCTQRSQCTLA